MPTTQLDADVSNRLRPSSKSRLPEKSFFFEKVVPASLIALGVVTIVLILFALGVLLGLIRF